MKKSFDSTRNRAFRKLINILFLVSLACLLPSCSEFFVKEKKIAEEVKVTLPSFIMDCSDSCCTHFSTEDIWNTVTAQLSSGFLPINSDTLPVVLYDKFMNPHTLENFLGSAVDNKYCVSVHDAKRIFNYNLQLCEEDMTNTSRYAGINALTTKNAAKPESFNAVLYLLEKDQFTNVKDCYPNRSLIPVVVSTEEKGTTWYGVAYMFSATADVFGILTLPGILPNPEAFNEIWENINNDTVRAMWGHSFPQDYLTSTFLGNGKPITTVE